MRLPMETSHFEGGLVPVADFLVNGAGVSTDIFNMKNHEWVRFVLFWGVGASGTNTLTVDACDDVVPTNQNKVPFWYRATTVLSAPGVITYQPTAATGYLTIAGSNKIIEIYTTAELIGATNGYGFVRLTSVPGVASALLGGCLAQMGGPKWADGAPVTATV